MRGAFDDCVPHPVYSAGTLFPRPVLDTGIDVFSRVDVDAPTAPADRLVSLKWGKAQISRVASVYILLE